MTITASTLSHFVPLNSLLPLTLEQLATVAEELKFSPGQAIFQQGKEDKRLYFLLEGEVALQQTGRSPRYLRAVSEEARYALDRSHPRSCTATAVTNARLLGIDESLLERRLSQDQATNYEIFEYDGDDDPQWMLDIITQTAFHDIPSANLDAMFARFEPVRHRVGDVIVRQGETGDYYYMIREGRAQVARAEPGKNPRLLAEIERGDGFGEEAILTGLPRNATVTMMTDGVLMRLGKQDFDALLKAPLLLGVDVQEAGYLIKTGAQLVDVRLEDEYRAGSLKDSVNLPLYLLRISANSLDTDKKYILFCQQDQRSSAAAFLLAQRGFDVYVLKGGLAAFPQEERVMP
jgi:CRP-like cAMP-binding protein/rhodanese-related sulfurtransferase